MSGSHLLEKAQTLEKAQAFGFAASGAVFRAAAPTLYQFDARQTAKVHKSALVRKSPKSP
jgi:hypothetical protein